MPLYRPTLPPSLSSILSAWVLSLICQHSNAGLIQGKVSSQSGMAIEGAIVTVKQDQAERSESVYTRADGSFRLAHSLNGPVQLRLRAPYFADKHIKLDGADAKALSLNMAAIEDKQALSSSLTASAHAALLEFERKDDKDAFRSQCHFCHQIGNSITRRPRSQEEWQGVMSRMQSYGALITEQNQTAIEASLKQGFNGKAIAAIQSHDASPELAKAHYQEWQIGNAASYIHDIEVGKDGLIYGVDMGNDKIYILNSDTHQRETIDLPPSELPLGGMFAGAIAPLGTFNAKHGPHSIQEGPEGKFWLTNSLSGAIMSFDPETREYKDYPIGEDAIYPHTLRWDQQGILWFTLALSNQIGRFDPKTERFTLIDTPSNGFWRWLSDAMLPSLLEVASWFPKEDLQLSMSHHKSSGEGKDILNLPYGIDIHPGDGSVWYSKLYAGYIGRLDPKTQEIKEFKTPASGPRRLRFDKQGNLWIPSFTESALMKFNPETEEFKVYQLPTLAPNEYEVPYALGVHPDTQEIWITSNLSDRVFRFLPKQERFISYPSPTRVTFMRDMVFKKDGSVCSSNANLPATAIEGGRPKILCINANTNF